MHYSEATEAGISRYYNSVVTPPVSAGNGTAYFRLRNLLEVSMVNSNDDPSEVADALNRLSTAMEQLHARYDSAERANRRVRIALIVALLLLGGAIYKVVSPIADQLGTIPQMISQALPGLKMTTLDPDAAKAERQRFMESLSAAERAQVDTFEKDLKWVSDYIATSEVFDPGATIALFLSQMAESVKVMPALLAEVHSMTDEVRSMNNEMYAMNDKMNALPVLASDVQEGMHAQMSALPVLATEVKGMHFYMSLMARDVDSTMGEAGRMMLWNW